MIFKPVRIQSVDFGGIYGGFFLFGMQQVVHSFALLVLLYTRRRWCNVFPISMYTHIVHLLFVSTVEFVAFNSFCCFRLTKNSSGKSAVGTILYFLLCVL